MIDTKGELAFIGEAQKGFNNIRSYWIGGFTDQPSGTLEYSDYYTSGSGKNIISPTGLIFYTNLYELDNSFFLV